MFRLKNRKSRKLARALRAGDVIAAFGNKYVVQTNMQDPHRLAQRHIHLVPISPMASSLFDHTYVSLPASTVVAIAPKKK